MGDKQKKKLTKKEQKAASHAKLMANKGSGQQPSNVVDIKSYKDQQDLKKAS